MERVEVEQWRGREVARLLALVESERRYYQEIVAAIPVGLLVLSHDLSVVSSNRAVRRIFGLRTGDSLRGRLETLLSESARDKLQAVFRGGETISDLIVEHGGRTLRLSVLPIRNGDEERRFEALLSIEDVTGVGSSARQPSVIARPALETTPDGGAMRQLAPAAEQPAPAEAVELLQSLDAIIWAVEIPKMNFLFITDTAEQVLGFSPDHWLDTPNFWAERIYAGDRDAILHSYEDAIANRRRSTCEFRATSADGRTLWLRETARLLMDADGNPKHLIGLTIDITQRRQMEEERIRAERMDALQKLSRRLSHDLNNVVMIVKGYGEELLHNAAKNGPMRADVQEILNATDRMSGITKQLLAFTRRQGGPAETVDLSEILNALAPALRETAGANVVVDLRPDPGLQAKAGRVRLEQLLTGLAGRAHAAMQDGGKLTITIGETQITENVRPAERILGPGRYAVITVEDSGGVLSHESQMALFESLLPERDLPAETGAVLSRGYTAVREWGGGIAVSSTAQSTRISVLLPFAGRKQVAAAPPPAAAPTPEAEPAEMEPQKPLQTILVVEDEGGIRALVRKILRRQGYTVLEAGSGEEAMKVCQEHSGNIDLLITDVMMPKMGGRELAERLKEQCRSIKVLYMSGYTDDASIYESDFPAGAAFLQKPFTLGSLLEKVKAVLSQ